MVGAQVGARLGTRMRPEHLRLSLALLVLAVGLQLAAGLVIPPDEPFSLEAPE